jgi:hypothetical protein
MPKLNIVVRAPKGIEEDDKELLILDWPAVPMKGQEINVASEGYVVDVRVIDVKHWIRHNIVWVHCAIEAPQGKESHDAFNSLLKKDGWEQTGSLTPR